MFKFVKALLVVKTKSTVNEEYSDNPLEYRDLNPLRPFINAFAIKEDLVLLDNSTGLVWGGKDWTNKLSEAVRAKSKTELKNKIPWYNKMMSDYYRKRYYSERGWKYKGEEVTLDMLKRYSIMSQSTELGG